MNHISRAITRLRDADDFSGTPSNGQAIVWVSANSRFEPTTISAGVTAVTAASPLASSGGATPQISVSGVLAIANGGTGSASQNFVDLSTPQTSAGNKTWTGLQTIEIQSAATKGKIIKGAASQTANLLEFQNSASTVLGGFTIQSGPAMRWSDANSYVSISNNMGSTLAYGNAQVSVGNLLVIAHYSTGCVLTFALSTATVALTGGMLQRAENCKRVSSNVTNATTTMATATGLSATLIASRKYSGRLVLFFDNDVAADGVKVDFDGGTATMSSFEAAVVSNIQGATLGTSVSAALATDLNATALSGTGRHCLEIAFAGVCNTAGTFIVRLAKDSHTTGTLTVRANSYMHIEDMA